MLESLFAVVFPLAMFAMMITLSMVISPFTFPVMFAIIFPASRFLGPYPPYFMAHFLGFLVFSLLLEGLDLAAFLVDPFA